MTNLLEVKHEKDHDQRGSGHYADIGTMSPDDDSERTVPGGDNVRHREKADVLPYGRNG